MSPRRASKAGSGPRRAHVNAGGKASGARRRPHRGHAPAPAQPADPEAQLRLFLGGKGHPADARERARALRFLLDHADWAHPRLLALLSPKARLVPAAVLDALPRFGRPGAVPALGKLVRYGNPEVSLAAAEALGRHPSPRAAAALLKLLRAGKPAAAAGLELRGEREALPALAAAAAGRDAELRYRALHALNALGGLDRPGLRRIAREDRDEDIRAWAASAARRKGSR
jgi:HEAT repeat protein